jgi:hypothetical protein
VKEELHENPQHSLWRYGLELIAELSCTIMLKQDKLIIQEVGENDLKLIMHRFHQLDCPQTEGKGGGGSSHNGHSIYVRRQ